MASTNSRIFADLSDNNNGVDLTAYAKHGHKRVALKATEDTGYVWAQFGRLAVEAYRLNLAVTAYHFARPSSGAAQAAHFIATVNAHIKPDTALCIDCEVAGVTAQIVDEWVNAVRAQYPAHEIWVYGSPSFLEAAGIHPAGCKLWLAEYGPTAKTPAGWERWDFWQYTATGTTVGVGGRVDLSVSATTAKPKTYRLGPGTRMALRHVHRTLPDRKHKVTAVADRTLMQDTRNDLDKGL